MGIAMRKRLMFFRSRSRLDLPLDAALTIPDPGPSTDEAARRRARRKYVRIIVNDFILNPGASMTPMSVAELAAEAEAGENDFERFGLMASFVARWARRLPEALARGAGEHVNIPPGNGELVKILEPFEK